jgi:hypothetical protein
MEAFGVDTDYIVLFGADYEDWRKDNGEEERRLL